MLKERFYDAAEQLFSKIRETQKDNIEKAAGFMADSVQHGGAIHLFDTGHIINSEIFNRAGGLVLMRRFSYGLTVDSDVRPRDMQGKNTSIEGLAAFALRQGNVLPGDTMVIGSVSGKTLNVIDLAAACRDYGVKTVGVTSVGYSSTLESMHSSKKRLFETADVTIDNCAPFGDAMLDVEGIEAKFAPASGIAAAYIMWAVNCELVELLLARGITPSVLKSVNYPPNVEYNNKLYQRFKDEGI